MTISMTMSFWWEFKQISTYEGSTHRRTHTHTHTHTHLFLINSLFFLYYVQLSVRCDENEQHIAVLYCTVCDTHLCVECSEMSHSMRTLVRHKRVPISEKPKENPKCVYHPMHQVEFACLEDECKSSPLMCYICKDYGRHMKHKARHRFSQVFILCVHIIKC